MARTPFDEIPELDATGTVSELEAVVRRRRAAEVDDLRLVAHWADLHASDPRDDPRGASAVRDPRGGDRLVQVGGEGTPPVRELSLCELGIARGVHTLSARAVLADALDLRHRLPRIGGLVAALQVEPWLARKVASMSRRLGASVVHVVDEAVADAMSGESPSRVLEVAEAKIIEADEAAHRARRLEEQHRRFVGTTRTDAAGLRTVIARVSPGDASWVDATIARVAEILAARPEHADASRDLLRSLAFGWLARPADLLALLLESADVPAAAGEAPDEEGVDAEPSRALALPADLLDALRNLDPARLRPRSVLYVHLSDLALAGVTAGVARVEGLGPHTRGEVCDLLGHANVTLTPVIDLAEAVSVNAYEHPEAVKERVHLLRPVDAFPHACRTSRNVDLDHPVPYDPLGPPGQTGSHTSQPLSRTAHRAKTHLGYTATPLGPGVTGWRTPHGAHRLVDAFGTHQLDEADHDALTGTDPVQRSLASLQVRLRSGQLALSAR